MHDIEVMRYCTYEWLRYIASIGDSLRAIEADIATQQARLTLMGYDPSSTRSGGCFKDRMPDGVAKLMELRDRWSDEYAAMADDLEEAKRICSPAHMARWCVWLHRVERMTWAAVGRKVGYSEQSARRIAEQGLREIYYAMPEEWRRDPIPNAAPR